MTFDDDDEVFRQVGLALQAIQSHYSSGRPLFCRLDRMPREVTVAGREAMRATL